jgi:hypothetical protein
MKMNPAYYRTESLTTHHPPCRVGAADVHGRERDVLDVAPVTARERAENSDVTILVLA